MDVDRTLTADEQTAYYDYTTSTDPQIQRAVATAQQMTGTTTVSGVNEADSTADSAADSAAAAPAEGEAASGAASATESEAASGSEPAASSAGAGE